MRFFIIMQPLRIGLVIFDYSCQLKCYLARFVAIFIFEAQLRPVTEGISQILLEALLGL